MTDIALDFVCRPTPPDSPTGPFGVHIQSVTISLGVRGSIGFDWVLIDRKLQGVGSIREIYFQLLDHAGGARSATMDDLYTAQLPLHRLPFITTALRL